MGTLGSVKNWIVLILLCPIPGSAWAADPACIKSHGLLHAELAKLDPAQVKATEAKFSRFIEGYKKNQRKPLTPELIRDLEDLIPQYDTHLSLEVRNDFMNHMVAEQLFYAKRVDLVVQAATRICKVEHEFVPIGAALEAVKDMIGGETTLRNLKKDGKNGLTPTLLLDVLDRIKHQPGPFPAGWFVAFFALPPSEAELFRLMEIYRSLPKDHRMRKQIMTKIVQIPHPPSEGLKMFIRENWNTEEVQWVIEIQEYMHGDERIDVAKKFDYKPGL